MQLIENTAAGDIFHVFNKSIAKFGIFKDPKNAEHFVKTLHYYNTKEGNKRFSYALRDGSYQYDNLLIPRANAPVKFICYCVMPDHYHIVLKILKDSSLSKYINDIEVSFSRYFNIKFKRKGPLWQSRFKRVCIKTDEQLLHVTRYVHLNPTTAGLVDSPEDWEFSSYRDYINKERVLKEIMTEIAITDPKKYKKFVDDRKDYQKKLAQIRKLLLE